MNTNLNPLPLDDPRFDQLADGELSEKERRELLAGLDSEPGGWRRCALAFLESQCWRQTFGAIAREGMVDEKPPAKATPRSRSRWSGWVGTVLAVAASFLLTFWVGSLVKQARPGRPATPAGSTSEMASNAGNRQLPAFPVQSERHVAVAAPQGHSAPRPLRMVTVSAPAGAGGAGSSFRVPAVERDNIDQQWLGGLPPAVPDDVMQAFARTGHQVEQHRELVPVPLKDGRQMIVPVDQVDVHYVGNETY